MMKLLLALTLLLTSGCAALLENRTFIDEMDHQTDSVFVPNQDFNVIPGDVHDGGRTRSEIANRTPMTAEERDASYDPLLEAELLRKEKNLTIEEYNRYSEVRPDLETTSEKIYYLNLSAGERESYLSSRARPALREPSSINSRTIRRGVRNGRRSFTNKFRYGRTINMGMGKEEVLKIWGRPARVEVAGDPENQNERWTFYRNGTVKKVYFEGGIVDGWASE